MKKMERKGGGTVTIFRDGKGGSAVPPPPTIAVNDMMNAVKKTVNPVLRELQLVSFLHSKTRGPSFLPSIHPPFRPSFLPSIHPPSPLPSFARKLKILPFLSLPPRKV
jgi:hypothetical protein